MRTRGEVRSREVGERVAEIQRWSRDAGTDLFDPR